MKTNLESEVKNANLEDATKDLTRSPSAIREDQASRTINLRFNDFSVCMYFLRFVTCN